MRTGEKGKGFDENEARRLTSLYTFVMLWTTCSRRSCNDHDHHEACQDGMQEDNSGFRQQNEAHERLHHLFVGLTKSAANLNLIHAGGGENCGVWCREQVQCGMGRGSGAACFLLIHIVCFIGRRRWWLSACERHRWLWKEAPLQFKLSWLISFCSPPPPPPPPPRPHDFLCCFFGTRRGARQGRR